MKKVTKGKASKDHATQCGVCERKRGQRWTGQKKNFYFYNILWNVDFFQVEDKRGTN
jgi:hypothetical protein